MRPHLRSLLRVAFILLIIAAAVPSLAQKKVQLKRADKLRGRGNEGQQRLIGDVVFIQNETTIYCDSAYFYRKRNYVEAFGNVRITDGDSVRITSRRLEYDGDVKVARLRNNVVFTKLGQATLYTDFLDYSRPANTANYYNGGRLVDSINVLTSQKGYYNLNTDMASFKRNVVVTNPDYTMTSDSLQYNSATKIIYFRTPTTVVDKDSNTFVYDKGFYETLTKQSDLELGTAETSSYRLVAEDYKLDDIQKKYFFRRNVVMTHKQENLIVYGQSADYFRRDGISKVYDNAYVAKVTDDNDTLFITADTLVAIDHSDPAKRKLLAYNNVKIFKSDMQGRADSLEYRSSDSTIYFYKDPVLWSEGNQMTADTVQMLITKNQIDRIYLNVKAFVISKDTVQNFNQIKGRRMTAFFRDDNISQVVVDGNGESVYFALQESTDSTKAPVMGLNRIICSNITIRFKEGKVNNLSFYVQPDAQFIPPHEVTPEDKTLEGFSWRIKEKPTRNQVVKPQLSDPQTSRKRL